MERWSGRVALVTGASVGIGAAICRELVKNGMKVVGCARQVEKIKAIAKESDLKSASGSLHAIQCDLSQEAEILSMFDEIRKTYGRLDVCINNAGISIKNSLLDGSTSNWNKILNVNVMALCICTREAVKLMREKNIDDGQIIHISSMAGHRIPGSTNNFYSGTKFMVRTLAEGLRRELKEIKSHIRVACVSPGLVETEFAYRMEPDSPEKAKELYASIESLQAEDVAKTVISILHMPPHVDINDILVRPVEQVM